MFTLCASRKWPVNSIDIKQPSSKVRIWIVQYLWDYPKKSKPTKYGNYKNVYMDRSLRQGIFYFYNRREMIDIASLFVDDLLLNVSIYDIVTTGRLIG